MPKQPLPLPGTKYELEIVLMNGEVIQKQFNEKQEAREAGHFAYKSGVWIAGKDNELVFVPGHRIRKMAIREKKPLSL